VTDDAYFTAPEGSLAAYVRLNAAWTWGLLALGAAVVAVGGVLL
jgi:hypothetical protein